MADRGTAVLPIVIVQQARTRLRAQIGQQTFQAVGSNLDAGAVRFQDDGFTDEHGPQPGPGVALEPISLWSRRTAPSSVCAFGINSTRAGTHGAISRSAANFPSAGPRNR